MSTDYRKRQSRDEALNEELAAYAKAARLTSWADFVQKLELPAIFVPAMLTMRSELMPQIQPTAFSAEDGEKLLKLIAGLIETNMALRQHAEQTAHLVDLWADAFKHLEGTGRRVQWFARFEHTKAQDVEEDGD